jgi:ATP-dependent exoDNAse (exonuclease V) beta subunit
MTEKEYRKYPAISRSELFKISESPEKFKYYQEHPEEPTPSLIFGQLFHAMALQPETVAEQFAVAPNVDRRTKEGKKEWLEFQEMSKGWTVVTEDMIEQATAMCEALSRNEFVQKLLKGKKEKPFFWNDDLTGEPCKCRVDCLTELGDSLIVVDLKSTENAETEAFMKSAIKYGYDLQSAMYSKGVEVNTGEKPLFVFIAIEKKPPYAINILQADELLIRRGYDLFREYIGIYHDCKQTGNWYGYLGKFNQINNLALPSYLAKEVE